MINEIDQTGSGRLTYSIRSTIVVIDIRSESQATKKNTDLLIQSRACPWDSSSFEIVAFPLSFFGKGKCRHKSS